MSTGYFITQKIEHTLFTWYRGAVLIWCEWILDAPYGIKALLHYNIDLPSDNIFKKWQKSRLLCVIDSLHWNLKKDQSHNFFLSTWFLEKWGSWTNRKFSWGEVKFYLFIHSFTQSVKHFWLSTIPLSSDIGLCSGGILM